MLKILMNVAGVSDLYKTYVGCLSIQKIARENMGLKKSTGICMSDAFESSRSALPVDPVTTLFLKHTGVICNCFIPPPSLSLSLSLSLSSKFIYLSIYMYGTILKRNTANDIFNE